MFVPSSDFKRGIVECTKMKNGKLLPSISSERTSRANIFSQTNLQVQSLCRLPAALNDYFLSLALTIDNKIVIFLT